MTLNVLYTRQRVMYEITKGNAIDTGMDHFGAVIGNNWTIGYFRNRLTGKTYSRKYNC